MAKIIEYKVVFDMTLAPFMRLVNEAIADGWQPNGGFTCDRSRYYQAMVKYEEDDMTPPVVVRGSYEIDGKKYATGA